MSSDPLGSDLLDLAACSHQCQPLSSPGPKPLLCRHPGPAQSSLGLSSCDLLSFIPGKRSPSFPFLPFLCRISVISSATVAMQLRVPRGAFRCPSAPRHLAGEIARVTSHSQAVEIEAWQRSLTKPTESSEAMTLEKQIEKTGSPGPGSAILDFFILRFTLDLHSEEHQDPVSSFSWCV